MLRPTLLCSLAATALGHGAMSIPRPRNSRADAPFTADASCIGDACYWYQVGCFNGCANCTGEGKYLYPKQSDFPEHCELAEPTNNDPKTRSWDPLGQSPNGDFTKYNPWRYPGRAPVRDPCGASSGYIKPSPYAETPKGYAPWSKGSEVLPPTKPTIWKAGATAEVGWAIAAQHGGGYSYRLCPKGSAITEECFRANPLEFVGDKHKIRFNDGSKPSFAINATQLTTGVVPEGSTWRRNPIPGCNCDVGAGCSVGGKGFHAAYSDSPERISSDVCPTGTMFPAPFKNAAGSAGFLVGHPMPYSIVDEVKVPTKEGEYLLQWRWDCEETNQVWNSCADIKVSSTEPPTPPPAPAPPMPSPTPKPPKPPTPKGKGCKALENPTCKGLDTKKGACPYNGCKKCHDETSWDCDECCDACSRTSKGSIHYCAGKKEQLDPYRDDLVEFLLQ